MKSNQKSKKQKDQLAELSDEDLEMVVGGLANEDKIRRQIKKFRFFWQKKDEKQEKYY